jgi:hypothetical protein
MLDRFQKEVLRVIAGNRSPDSFIAGGSVLNRSTARLSRDLDLFHKTVALIDTSLAHDLDSLKQAGFETSRVRETSTMREWLVLDRKGQSTKIQWTRDTSWLFFPAVPDAEFGYALTFEDLAVNKMSAAADRGRIRDYHDLVALDLLGAKPWVLALAVMGKDSELSPPAVLERAIRLLAQAGDDDEDPDYEGPGMAWLAVRTRMNQRLRADLELLNGMSWIEWAGVLPIDQTTGRMALNLTPETIGACAKARATPSGTWPTSLAATSEMLRRSEHPALASVTLDISALVGNPEASRLDSGVTVSSGTAGT